MNMGVYFFKFCLKSLNRLEKKSETSKGKFFDSHCIYSYYWKIFSLLDAYVLFDSFVLLLN